MGPFFLPEDTGKFISNNKKKNNKYKNSGGSLASRHTDDGKNQYSYLDY